MVARSEPDRDNELPVSSGDKPQQLLLTAMTTARACCPSLALPMMEEVAQRNKISRVDTMDTAWTKEGENRDDAVYDSQRANRSEDRAFAMDRV